MTVKGNINCVAADDLHFFLYWIRTTRDVFCDVYLIFLSNV